MKKILFLLFFYHYALGQNCGYMSQPLTCEGVNSSCSIGGGLGSRVVLSCKPLPKSFNENGHVNLKICVDENGKVISSTIMRTGTNTQSLTLKDLAQKNVKSFLFASGEVACGTILYVFNVDYLPAIENTVAYYPLDGVYSGNVYEKIRNGNNNNQGKLQGAVALTTNRRNSVNSAFNFMGSGNNSAINCENPYFDISNQVTLSTWVKTATKNTFQVIAMKYGADNHGFVLGIGGIGTEGNYVNFSGRDGSGIYRTTNSKMKISDDKWHHVVGVCNINIWQIWVNGKLINEIDTQYKNTDLNSSSNFNIGYCEQYNQGYFIGAIDDVSLYNRALTKEEILKLYKE